jgi:alkylation response protein AidB-like acyl-CoA dehydrogenase
MRINKAEPALLTVEPPPDTVWAAPGEIAKLTAQDVVARITALKPAIAARSDETERERRIPTDLWHEILGTGALYHYVPRRFGGLELGLEQFVDVVLPLAEACASTGWVTGFSMEHNWLACHFPEPAQQEFFGKGRYIVSPGVGNPPGQAVRVPRGYKVSGHWRFGTGVMNSNWVIAMVLVDGTSGPFPHWSAFPTSQIQVLDTWYADGLAGTASHDIVAKEVFIPEHMIVAMHDMRQGTSPGAKLHDNPLYRIPLVPLLNMTVTPTVVGAAKGAIQIFRERLRTRRVFGSQSVMADNANVQACLAQADLLVRTSEILLRHLACEILKLANQGRSDDIAARKAIVAQNAYAGRLARDAVRIVMEGSGASVHLLTDPLQRIWRDVSVASSHVAHDFATLAEQHGKSLLGLEPAVEGAMIF